MSRSPRSRASLLSIALTLGGVCASTTAAHADEPLASSRPSPTLASHLDASWVLDATRDTHGFHIERFVQRFEGLRVDGAHAVVRARRDGAVDLVSIETPVRRGTVIPGRVASAPDHDRLLAAIPPSAIGFVPITIDDVEPVLAPLAPESATLVLAHRVTVLGRSRAERVSVLIEHATLRVLRVDLLVHDARGLVYLRNSASDEGMTTEVELPAQTDPDTLTNGAFTVRSCMVSARGDCVPIARAVPDTDGNFLIAPEPASFEDGFAEVMAFHHANLLADRLERDHGFRWQCTADGGDDSLQILANFTDAPGRAYANAAFVGGSRSQCGFLLFGQSGNQDFASDADVVYHELGHAVTDQITDIVGFAVDPLGMHYDPLAVNEGTSDYWAATTQGDPHVGESLEGLDGLGRSAALRDLDGALRCPNDLIGEGHFDGRIWAGVFWDLRTELGEEKVDALVFATVSSLGSAPTLRDAGETAATTADSLATMGTLTSADATRARELLMERGLLDCRRITPLDDGERRAGFSGLAFLTGGLGNDIAPVHYSIELPPDATSVTIEVTPGAVIGQYAVLARRGQPIGFRGGRVQSDQRDEVGHAGSVTYHRSDAPFEPCSTMYFAIETMDFDRGENLYLVEATLERSGDPAARCPEPEPDAGVPDAFVTFDAGESPDAAMDGGGMPGGGCGCRATTRDHHGDAGSLVALGVLVAVTRRRRAR